MLIDTTRFGCIEVDGERLITFKEGILGFPAQKRYALIQTSTDPVFFWLQAVDDPALAFVVCDPLVFVPDFQVPIRADDVATLDLASLDDSQVLVIVNRIDGYLTANLMGPLVIGATSRIGKQLVLSDKRFSARRRLMKLEPLAPLARSA